MEAFFTKFKGLTGGDLDKILESLNRKDVKNLAALKRLIRDEPAAVDKLTVGAIKQYLKNSGIGGTTTLTKTTTTPTLLQLLREAILRTDKPAIAPAATSSTRKPETQSNKPLSGTPLRRRQEAIAVSEMSRVDPIFMPKLCVGTIQYEREELVRLATMYEIPFSDSDDAAELCKHLTAHWSKWTANRIEQLFRAKKCSISTPEQIQELAHTYQVEIPDGATAVSACGDIFTAMLRYYFTAKVTELGIEKNVRSGFVDSLLSEEEFDISDTELMPNMRLAALALFSVFNPALMNYVRVIPDSGDDQMVAQMIAEFERARRTIQMLKFNDESEVSQQALSVMAATIEEEKDVEQQKTLSRPQGKFGPLLDALFDIASKIPGDLKGLIIFVPSEEESVGMLEALNTTLDGLMAYPDIGEILNHHIGRLSPEDSGQFQSSESDYDAEYTGKTISGTPIEKGSVVTSEGATFHPIGGVLIADPEFDQMAAYFEKKKSSNRPPAATRATSATGKTKGTAAVPSKLPSALSARVKGATPKLEPVPASRQVDYPLPAAATSSAAVPSSKASGSSSARQKAQEMISKARGLTTKTTTMTAATPKKSMVDQQFPSFEAFASDDEYLTFIPTLLEDVTIDMDDDEIILLEYLQQSKGYTLFLPTIKGLSTSLGIPKEQVAEALNDALVDGELTFPAQQVLNDEAISPEQMKQKIADGDNEITTIDDEATLTIDMQKNKLTVNGLPIAKIVKAGNGYVYLYDGFITGSTSSVESEEAMSEEKEEEFDLSGFSFTGARSIAK